MSRRSMLDSTAPASPDPIAASPVDGLPGSLAEDRQRVAVDRVLRATITGLSRCGTSVSVEEIARIAGLGRRTVFRYFPTRDELLAAALRRVFVVYANAIPDPTDGVNVEQWLTEVATAAHRMNATLGPGYWQLILEPEPSPVIAEVLAERTRARQDLSRRLARTAWTGSGHTGPPPPDLVRVMTLVLGPLATAALRIDDDVDAAAAAGLTCTMIMATMERLARTRTAR